MSKGPEQIARSLAAGMRNILGASAVAVLCSIGVGFLIYQSRVFNPYDHAFTFIVDAAVGSLFFYSLRKVSVRESLVLLFFMYLVVMGPVTHAFHAGAALPFTVFFLSVPLAVYVYHDQVVNKHRWESVFPPFIVAGFWGSTTILARLCVDLPRAMFWQRSFLDYPAGILPDVLMGAAVGFGVGLGFFIVDRIRVSNDSNPAAQPGADEEDEPGNLT